MGNILVGWGDRFLVTWKWWVWKSSMTWSLANLLSQKWEVLILDTDSAPSSIDVHWFDWDITEDHMLHTRILQVRNRIASLLLWPIVPDEICYLNDDAFLNLFMDKLLNSDYWLLPMLRLELHWNFYWLWWWHALFAKLLQLIDLFIEDTYYSVNVKEWQLWNQRMKLWWDIWEYRIVDSENTSGFFGMVWWLDKLLHTVEAMDRASSGSVLNVKNFLKDVPLRAFIESTPNLRVLCESDIMKNPQLCESKFRLFQEIVKNRLRVVMVTRPWITEFNQLKSELKILRRRWSVNLENVTVLINFYRDALKKSRDWTMHFVDATKRFIAENIGQEVAVKLIDCDYVQPDIWLSQEEKVKIIDENFQRVWECLVA